MEVNPQYTYFSLHVKANAATFVLDPLLNNKNTQKNKSPLAKFEAKSKQVEHNPKPAHEGSQISNLHKTS